MSVCTAEEYVFDSKACFHFVEMLQVLLPAEAAFGVVRAHRLESGANGGQRLASGNAVILSHS